MKNKEARRSELQKLLQKISNPQTSLKEAKELYEKGNIDIVSYYTNKKLEIENLPLEVEIYKKTVEKFSALADDRLHGKKMQDNFHLFTDEELELFKWSIDKLYTDLFKKLASVWDSLGEAEKKGFEQGFLQGYTQIAGKTLTVEEIIELMKRVKENIDKIQVEIDRRRQVKEQEENQSDSAFFSPDSSNNNSFDNQTLEKEINNLQNQLSNLRTQQQTQPTTDNFSELKKIKQVLNQLQNNLQNIEKKQNSVNSLTSQQEKQETAKLKNKLTELQNQLKQSQVNQPKQQNAQQSEKGFNWLYVVVPGGILLVIAGMVITYLWGKSKKRE